MLSLHVTFPRASPCYYFTSNVKVPYIAIQARYPKNYVLCASEINPCAFITVMAVNFIYVFQGSSTLTSFVTCRQEQVRESGSKGISQ